MKFITTNLLLLTFATFSGGIIEYIEPIVLVHGGADNVHGHRIEERSEKVKQAAVAGFKILKQGGNVVDAVETAIKIMEKDPSFNAGHGSALNHDGEVEMDAGIMVGKNLTSGSVSGIKNVAHPISLARLVMEKSPHFMLSGEGARHFAKDQRMAFVSPYSLITPHARKELEEYLRAHSKHDKYMELGVGCGGVGAIAVDAKGHVAAGASTGGRLGKLPGRASDASIVGAGFYADDEIGAVVVTGHGEAIARYVMAHEIINQMKRGFDAGTATRNIVKGITEMFRKPTGAITVSRTGHIGISFTTPKMAWAYQHRDDVHYGVDDYDHFSEKIRI